MKKNSYVKNALAYNVIALILCFSMLLGSTFAWFTDSVTSENNVIQTGSLDVEMYWAEGKEDPSSAAWKDASTDAIFNNDRWEPGFAEVRHIKIENKGTLALQYKVMITPNGEVSELAEVIDVYYVDPAVQVTGSEALVDEFKLGTLADVLEMIDETASGFLASGDSDTVTLALKMHELADDDYQGLALCEGGFSVQLIATQAAYENDSFGNDYDKNAVAAIFPGFQGGAASISVALNEAGTTKDEVSVDAGDVAAKIPAGVMLAEGHNSLTLAVTLKNTSDANIQVGETEKMRPLDVHIEGVSADNETPMLVTLYHYLATGFNTGALKLYHVENGTPVAMTQVETPVNHNEFSYDPLTGDVTLALASFSEVAVVADTNNPWDGKTETPYIGSGTESDPYLIVNADNLAYFRTQVDNGNSFEGKFVKLNNNIYLSGKLFDPIGWGYINESHNREGVAGKVFQGTFDGGQYDEKGELVGRYTIFDLYQSGWDLESKTGTDYTYTNCGFGLFAAASGATFKNLTISGAYVRAECVEMGVLVGLSQNNCTYDNIKILNSKIANYQRPAGGLIGEVSGSGTTTITNVTIGDDVVVGSLWGDFDAPCGGVIGARWDDVGANPQIEMKYVDVGARMDVYNDITSAYQWHAYRRAGMLIGNTEQTDKNNKHLAAADFLTCLKDKNGNETVKVYYGDWVNYTYCSFSNHNERYPWVRTQVGENCEAFSNPRWGVPNDANENRVTDMNHVHAEGDECNILRQFSQLYGGGQGVYGQDKHEGVTVVDSYYSITYVNDGKTLDIVYVTNNANAYPVANDQAQKLVLEWAEENMKEDYNSYVFGGWMTAASVKLDKIPENNTKNIVLYPYFTSPYTASFVDENSNILAWCFFNEINVDNLPATFAEAKKNLPNPGDEFELLHWVIRDENGKIGELDKDNTNWDSFKNYKDVTITPKYRYNGAELIEVYDELTGEITHYQVAGYADGKGSESVEIPAYVNGKPVTTINMDAFGSYDDLYSVRIPATIDVIKGAAFADDDKSWGVLQRETITLYFEGTPEQWKTNMDALYKNKSRYTDRNSNIDKNATTKFDSNWDQNMGDGSRVFFLDENGKVDNTCYWELCKVNYGFLNTSTDYIWVFHDHAYDNHEGRNCASWTSSNDKPNYAEASRPDKEYWEGVTSN